MHTARIAPTLESWREEARSLLARRVHPDAVLWCDASDEPPLFLAESSLTGKDEATGREQFVAWFEPEHRIVRLKVKMRQQEMPKQYWKNLPEARPPGA